MTPLPDIDCSFGDAPLMLALAQITFTQSPEIFKNITDLKTGLSKLDMPVAQLKQQVNFSVKLGGAAPQVTQNEVWWFFSLDKKRAVAAAQNSVVLYDASYSNFDDFSALMQKIIEITSYISGDGSFLTTVALRYLSGFPSDGSPSPYLISGLHGLPVGSLRTGHFHHNYSFWCDTDTDDGGKLVLSAKTVHGNQLIPQDISTAGVEIDGRFSLPKEIDAVQLDIHETVQRKKMERFETQEIKTILATMRRNVKLCFLTATTEGAHNKWMITNN